MFNFQTGNLLYLFLSGVGSFVMSYLTGWCRVMRGEGGKKSTQRAWHHLWMAPNHSWQNCLTECNEVLYHLGALHKVRHNIFGQFLPPSLLSHFVTHLGPSPRFLEGLVQKPLVPILSQLFAGVFVRRFCQSLRGSFVWRVLSGVVFVRSRSVRIHLLHQEVKHHFKFHVLYVW